MVDVLHIVHILKLPRHAHHLQPLIHAQRLIIVRNTLQLSIFWRYTQIIELLLHRPEILERRGHYKIVFHPFNFLSTSIYQL